MWPIWLAFVFLFILNKNSKFYLLRVRLEQYIIIILLCQPDFFLCEFTLIFLCYIIILLAIVYFMELLALDYLMNLCNCWSIFWVMIVCEETFVYLQTIWQGCVRVSSSVHSMSARFSVGRVRVGINSHVSLPLDLVGVGHGIMG